LKKLIEILIREYLGFDPVIDENHSNPKEAFFLLDWKDESDFFNYLLLHFYAL
jgi:hypothetical protein